MNTLADENPRKPLMPEEPSVVGVSKNRVAVLSGEFPSVALELVRVEHGVVVDDIHHDKNRECIQMSL